MLWVGGGIVVHSRNGKAESVTQTIEGVKRPDIVPSVNRRQAISVAGTHFDVASQRTPSARLVVYARGDATPALAYEVRYVGVKKDQTPTDMRYIVDAHTGKLLDKWDTVHTAGPGRDPRTCDAPASGIGTGLYVGQVDLGTAQCSNGYYQLTDPDRGGGRTTNMSNRKVGLGAALVDPDNVWGNGTNSNSQTVAVDAHYGVSTTWDYYEQIHNRSGIADDGQGALSRVHYGRNYANAFWSDGCFCMTFGDGNGSSVGPLVEIDVAAGWGVGSGANLAEEDMVCNGDTSLAGIGREAAEKIWYLALTGYMVEDTDYAGARVATLNAATDLYGAESAEYTAVAASWSAVSVE